MRKRGTTDAQVFVPKVCKVEDCGRSASVLGSGRGWCGKHYQRWRAHGDPLTLQESTRVVGVAECSVSGCVALVIARGWCTKHYTRWERYGDPTARMPGEVVDGRRVCPRCEVDKHLAKYGGGRVYCLVCSAARTAEYRLQNPYTPVEGWPGICECCGQDFMANKKRSKHCSPECSEDSLWKYAAKRRARLVGGLVEVFDRREIFERDGWRCQICGQAVDPKSPRYSYNVPSIDHIIPIARGGEHSRANVQTACLGCNVRKGAKLTT